MTTTKNILWAVLFMTIANLCYGQVGNYLSIYNQTLKMPLMCQNLSIVDGKLYGCSGGIMLSSTEYKGQLSAMEVDVEMMNIDEQMDYIVRHPVTKDLYFTKKHRSGRSQLYKYSVNGKKTKVEHISIGSPQMSVMHPVFSKDGKLMVFVSDDIVGFGGYDLWYCRYIGNKWQDPQNLGHIVNSSGDEMNPCIYEDFLIFASKGRPSSIGGFNLYATRLLSLRQGDTVRMLPIGESEVQSLPSPINTQYDDIEITIDPASHRGFWITRKDSVDRLREFCGSLVGTMIYGNIKTEDGNPVINAELTLMLHGNECGKTTTDENGSYKIFVKSDEHYKLVVKKEGCFSNTVEISTERVNEDLMISETEKNIVLDKLEIGTEYSLGNIYGPRADIELTSKGKNAILRVVSFLKDNPLLKAEWHIWSEATNNEKFNIMVTDQRIKVLTTFLKEHGIDERRLKMINTNDVLYMENSQDIESMCIVVIVENI